MKFLSRALFVLFLLAGALVAVSNPQPVELSLWPLPYALKAPLYLLIVGLLFVGVLAGLGMGWWAARHHRRRARKHGSEAARLDRENARLRGELDQHRAAAQASAPTGAPPPAGQRAIERQSALVSPDSFSS
ncbi:MAG TPA: LapA family protein [Reyranella sp.]|nr:LapA family protein [Reyranella sp.]